MKKKSFLESTEETIPEHIFPYNNLTIQVIHISLQNQIQSNLDKRMIFNGSLAATVIQRKYEDFSLSVLHTHLRRQNKKTIPTSTNNLQLAYSQPSQLKLETTNQPIRTKIIT